MMRTAGFPGRKRGGRLRLAAVVPPPAPGSEAPC